MNRRRFLEAATQSAFGVGVASCFPAAVLAGAGKHRRRQLTAREFLESRLYTREEVERWLAGKAFPFAKYHSDFGWLLPNARFRDGVDKSVCVYTYVQPDGERTLGNYADQPCRINTYGNSFTQCHQVSDHETWQEQLAAHLQEPVRNFGIGGWSVYQAYLRMLKEEQRKPAKVIIFNIYDDDHRRNLDSWRNIRRGKHVRFIEPTLPHVRVNLARDAFEERPNPCPTPESLYDLCDLEKTHELFKDDFVLKIILAHNNAKTRNPFQSYRDVMALASTHGIETSIETNEHLSQTAHGIHNQAALFSTRKIVEKIEAYARAHGKKVLYVLSYPPTSIARRIKEGSRWDQPFVDFLKRKNLPVVDMIDAHLKDFEKYKIDVKEYLRQYFVGHYNPRGNHFCAFAIKDRLVAMMDPKPIPYRKDSAVLR
ncbi:MAG: SGNH/GDSL hydrolase family protein [Pirellulales bacterium]|nr:SGNH/GDSL hydrolase family protein [Pirellulales bacterium]